MLNVPGKENWRCWFSCFITLWSGHRGHSDLLRYVSEHLGVHVWSMRGKEPSLERKKRFRWCYGKETHFSKMKLLITVSILSSLLIFISVIPWSLDAMRGKYSVGIALLQSNRNTKAKLITLTNQYELFFEIFPFLSDFEYCPYDLPGVDWSAGSLGNFKVERPHYFLRSGRRLRFFISFFFSPFLFAFLFLHCDWFH